MTDPFVPRVGGVLSADIAVPDHEQTVQFYVRVLTTGKDPFWRDDLMNNRGMPVIGLGPQSPEYAGLPLQWMPHIQVADVAASVARALELGGRELLHGKDDAGQSLWAGVLDPNGAAFGLIPVVTADQVPPVEGDVSRVGRIAWFDLTVPDAAATRDFYRQVVGWTAEDVEMKDGGERYADYNLLGGDGEPVGGVCHARGMNQDLPPIWLIYLPVGDLEESLRRVQEGGGKVLKESRGSDGKLSYAVIQDPVGARLALAPG